MVRGRESKQDQVQKCDFLGGGWGKEYKKKEGKKFSLQVSHLVMGWKTSALFNGLFMGCVLATSLF